MKLLPYDKIVLNAVALDKVREYMLAYYELPPQFIDQRLSELEDTHGDYAVIGMWGWFIHAEANHLQRFQIYPVISQDLDKRNDTETTLLTSEFINVAKEYFYNNVTN